MRNYLILPTVAIAITMYLCSCVSNNQSINQEKKSIPLHYAKRFKVYQTIDATILELLGNKNDSTVTATFVLYSNQKPQYSQQAYYIKTPVNSVASLSSIYTTMLDKLGVIQHIVAIDNLDYYNNTFIQQAVEKKQIQELSKGPQINVEQTLALNPDLIFTFGMGNPKADIDKKIIEAGIPVAISLDHLEETPLARAEWIKFFSYFFGKEQLADSLFSITEKNYNQLKTESSKIQLKPSVLTEIKYGDTWYVPAGNSYMAHLINDAGGNYFFKNDSSTGSIPLNFESVYTKAKECDVWINLYNVNSKQELLSYDNRYSLFSAFQKGKLYNNNKTQNSKGYSNYWETGITNPDDILKDLQFIFATNALPNQQLKYYKQIE